MALGFVAGAGASTRVGGLDRRVYGCERRRGRVAVGMSFEQVAPLIAAAEVPVWLPAAQTLCGAGLNVFNIAMVIRIFLSWYPKVDVTKVPWVLAVVPTEPILRATRKLAPPVGGVDISPIIWIFIASFVQEITVGPQGILMLLADK